MKSQCNSHKILSNHSPWIVRALMFYHLVNFVQKEIENDATLLFSSQAKEYLLTFLTLCGKTGEFIHFNDFSLQLHTNTPWRLNRIFWNNSKSIINGHQCTK